MSIGPINSTGNIPQIGSQINFKQVKIDFQNLTKALQSGDIAAAKEALASLQKDDPKIAKALGQNGQNSTDPRISALQSLSTALQSGNVADAKTALASLQSTFTVHHGHHHHGVDASAMTAQTQAANTNNASDVSLAGDNSNLSSSKNSLNALA